MENQTITLRTLDCKKSVSVFYSYLLAAKFQPCATPNSLEAKVVTRDNEVVKVNRYTFDNGVHNYTLV